MFFCRNYDFLTQSSLHKIDTSQQNIVFISSLLSKRYNMYPLVKLTAASIRLTQYLNYNFDNKSAPSS